MMRNGRIVASTLLGLMLLVVVLTGLFGVLDEAVDTGLGEVPAEAPFDPLEAVSGDAPELDDGGGDEEVPIVGGDEEVPVVDDELPGPGDPGGGGGPGPGETGSNQTSEDGELSVTPHPGPNGGYAVGDGEDLGIEMLRVNPSSETSVPRIFQASYSGDGEVRFWVEAVEPEGFPGDVRFFATAPEHVWFDEEAVVLGDGETADVGLFVSSFDAAAGDTLLEDMVLHAERVGDG